MLETYRNLTDEELIRLLREGNHDIMDVLLERYKGLVRKKANALFLVGGDKDDLNQEGMIGLLKAVREYDGRKNDSFAAFAALCVNRQMYTAIEASNRLKNAPLNGYVSLSTGNETDAEWMMVSALPSMRAQEPESSYLDQEALESLQRKIYDALSPLEVQVLDLYLEGKNYLEIAGMLDRPSKSVDNALQRIKAKVEKIVHK